MHLLGMEHQAGVSNRNRGDWVVTLTIIIQYIQNMKIKLKCSLQMGNVAVMVAEPSRGADWHAAPEHDDITAITLKGSEQRRPLLWKQLASL